MCVSEPYGCVRVCLDVLSVWVEAWAAGLSSLYQLVSNPGLLSGLKLWLCQAGLQSPS